MKYPFHCIHGIIIWSWHNIQAVWNIGMGIGVQRYDCTTLVLPLLMILL